MFAAVTSLRKRQLRPAKLPSPERPISGSRGFGRRIEFDLTSRLTVVDHFQPDLVLVDTEVTGSGLVVHESRIVRHFKDELNRVHERAGACQ